MKVFFDANILLDVALWREQFLRTSEDSMMYCVDHNHDLFVSWHTVSNVYYLIRNKKTRDDAYNFLYHFITDLGIEIAPISTENIIRSFSLDMNDFEDAMQIAAAESCKADIIITRNVDDFGISPIAVMTPDTFLTLHQI